MDRFSVWMVRTSLAYLGTGVILGALLLVADGFGTVLPFPGLSVVHFHLLFVGWLMQFALGVAYWLLPRRRSPDQPLAYDERLAFLAYVALNIGLILRAVAQPFGMALGLPGWLLVVSGVLQSFAVVAFVGQLWSRVRRAPR